MVLPGYRVMLKLELLGEPEGARNSLCAYALRLLSRLLKFDELFFLGCASLPNTAGHHVCCSPKTVSTGKLKDITEQRKSHKQEM